MALRKSHDLTPVLPDWESLDLDRVVLSYDDASDTMMVHFGGRGVPAYGDPVSDGRRDVYLLRISFANDQIVGVQIEDFRARFSAEYSGADELLLLAERPGSEVSSTARPWQPEEVRELRPTVLSSLLRYLRDVAA